MAIGHQRVKEKFVAIFEAPTEEISDLINKGLHIGYQINFDILNFLGIFILKSALNDEKVGFYKSLYEKSEDITKTKYHNTNMTFPEDHKLTNIVREPEIVNIAKQFFGGNVGYAYPQIFRKNASDNKPVFLHHDSSYLTGRFERYSCFIALTDCNGSNGSIVVYPGTHNFGYLADAGEINQTLVEAYPHIQTDLEPGDVLIMHSAVWHSSPENTARTERVYMEIKFQDANDPSTLKILCGERTSKWRLYLTNDEIFSNSRTQRIKNLSK